MNSFNFIVSSTSTCGEKSVNLFQVFLIYKIMISFRNVFNINFKEYFFITNFVL
ncbi:hypothetical protein [Spiroplasma ixodetis]|uniref:hypothetical protein n=1 Tax=Spiroplasma ixodetis TaxID=2141 RepID=UPI0025763540|nr:hypothetical protein [Spiroplasma ixodetis]